MAYAYHNWVLFLVTIPIIFAGAEDTMFNGERLLTNQFLQNDPYTFIMQDDCNLVLYVKQGSENRALWSSRTNGHGNSCNMLLQNNGNLVVFSGPEVVWSSGSTRGPNSYRLVMQGDGNVVIYGGATWATNTVQRSKTKINV